MTCSGPNLCQAGAQCAGRCTCESMYSLRMVPAGSGMASAIEYAQHRHQETGRRYLVTDFERSLYDCRENRQVVQELGEQVVYVSKPTS